MDPLTPIANEIGIHLTNLWEFIVSLFTAVRAACPDTRHVVTFIVVISVYSFGLVALEKYNEHQAEQSKKTNRAEKS